MPLSMLPPRKMPLLHRRYLQLRAAAPTQIQAAATVAARHRENRSVAVSALPPLQPQQTLSKSSRQRQLPTAQMAASMEVRPWHQRRLKTHAFAAPKRPCPAATQVVSHEAAATAASAEEVDAASAIQHERVRAVRVAERRALAARPQLAQRPRCGLQRCSHGWLRQKLQKMPCVAAVQQQLRAPKRAEWNKLSLIRCRHLTMHPLRVLTLHIPSFRRRYCRRSDCFLRSLESDLAAEVTATVIVALR